jgi:LysM domain
MPARLPAPALLLTALALATSGSAIAQGTRYPVTPAQMQAADEIATQGVPLVDLAANAPDSHTVKEGDTLWDISKLFLKGPWRWPELWGMNRKDIANPHLIYPGQLLRLVRRDGRAMLETGAAGSAGSGVPGDAIKLKPRMRISTLDETAIASIPLSLIQPFLTDTVVFDTDALATAPRIVAATEGRVLISAGENAYARGDFGGANDFRIFRQARPLVDPDDGAILAYEAPYVGTAELVKAEGEAKVGTDTLPVPATLRIKTVRQEVASGDRLSPVPQRNYLRYVPHAPASAVSGRIVSLHGDALSAGQNQIVVLNRGSSDGIERGHVLSLWRNGRIARDTTGERPEEVKLPDERHGLLFVFEVYQRVSYALIMQVREPVRAGDRFSEP